jgi:uncharacterized protein (DUF1015 family)
VITRTADTYSKKERERILQKNPDSFLHVIFPEAGQKQKRTRPNSKERFRKVRERFDEFHHRGVFIQEDQPALYLYELSSGNDRYIGFIGGASVEERERDLIKKHEQTLEKREELLKEYLKVCDINADPVLLCHPDREDLKEIVRGIREGPPSYDLVTEDDGRRHRLWPILDQGLIDRIRGVFDRIPALYIADGHHRSASSVRLAEEMQEASADRSNEAGFEHFMAYFLPESQLRIHGYHRCIKDLNGYDPKDFLRALHRHFRVIPSGTPVEANALHEFGLYLDGKWYRLHPHPESFDHDDPVGSLDASILYDRVLLPLLDVRDPRNSERVHFHGAPKGLDPMVADVDRGKFRLAFTLAPVPLEQLKEVADRGMVMPPKTTWIEPKLRSGLLIYRMGLHGSGSSP